MDISKFKNLTLKLSFLKSYSSLLLPIAISVIGILLFLPTQWLNVKLKKQMLNDSVSVGKRIQSLSKNTIVSDQWKVEEAYQQSYAKDANEIALLARQSSERDLLSYKVFPEPKDTSILIFKEFGKRYCNAIEGLVARAGARDCPTMAELEKSLQSSTSTGYRLSSTGGSRKLGEVEAAIVEVICRGKAESGPVYANLSGLGGYEFWKKYEYSGMDAAIKDCWSWQLGYWIIEDVVDTVAACNAGSRSVFTSPVKRLLGVAFAGRYAFGRVIADKKPVYVSTAGEGLTESCTGRFSNDDIDVVHFNVAVIVNAKDVLMFMQQLCSAKRHKFRGFSGDGPERNFKHNQITILESNILPVNRDDPTHYFYRYGSDAVVELDLICEYIFKKEGYDKVKPKVFKGEEQTERGK